MRVADGARRRVRNHSHRNANADIVDNAAKCKHGYAHTCVCRGECDACARCTGYAHGGMTKK